MVAFLDLCQWKRKVSIKSLNPKDTRQKRAVTAFAMSTILHEGQLQLLL